MSASISLPPTSETARQILTTLSVRTFWSVENDNGSHENNRDDAKRKHVIMTKAETSIPEVVHYLESQGWKMVTGVITNPIDLHLLLDLLFESTSPAPGHEGVGCDPVVAATFLFESGVGFTR